MASELARQVGARIRQRREELGLNQREFAARFESDAVNNQRVSDWERGVHKPSDRYMDEIAAILERDVAWFYAGDEPEVADLMGALSGEDRLVRVERKLDTLLSLVSEKDRRSLPDEYQQVFLELELEDPATAGDVPAPSPIRRRRAG